MAGPDRRRAARRARTITALLSLTALALLSLDSRLGEHSPFDVVRHAVAAAVGPLEQGTSQVTEPLRAIAAGEDVSPSTLDELASLRSEVARLKAENRTSDFAAKRAAELDALLRLASVGQYAIVPAQVIAVSAPQGAERTVTIDAGTIDGIAEQMTVVNGDGLVGRVISVGPSTATVQLVIDRSAAVGARLEGSLQLGIASGNGSALGFSLLNPLEAMAAGDRLVTFGSGDDGAPYVAGVPVGTVRSIAGELGSLTRTAVVTPFADFTALDLIGVVVEPPRIDPRDRLLLPRSPGATP